MVVIVGVIWLCRFIVVLWLCLWCSFCCFNVLMENSYWLMLLVLMWYFLCRIRLCDVVCLMLLNDRCRLYRCLFLFSFYVFEFYMVLVGCRVRILLCSLMMLWVSDSENVLVGV